MEYKIISSGSKGNCAVFDNRILIDCGVPYRQVQYYEKSLQVVFYTHTHSDHYKKETILKLQFNRPALRVGCSEHDAEILKQDGVQNIDILKAGDIYIYEMFDVATLNLYHDVPTVGYRLFFGNSKIFFATDTNTLDGITARNYTHYFIECNFDEDTILDKIYQKRERGEFVHNIGSLNTHLSMQQAHEFILKNVSPGHKYDFIPLHISSEF